jgi:hypothetical protein
VRIAGDGSHSPTSGIADDAIIFLHFAALVLTCRDIGLGGGMLWVYIRYQKKIYLARRAGCICRGVQ